MVKDIRVLESLKDGLKVRIRLISAGMGSSGYYSAAVLEQDGVAAFPAGTHLYFNHLTESEYWDRSGSRDVKDLIGKTLTDVEYVAEEEALYADALIYDSAAKFVAEVFEDVDLSIEAKAKRDDTSGEITALVPDPTNAVALVPRGGRDGKITAIFESVKKSDKIVSIKPNSEKEPFTVKPEDIEAVAKAVQEALKPTLESITESLKPKEPKEEAPKIKDVVEALIKADLPETLRDKVYESDKPMDVLENIKSIRESLNDKSGKKEAEPGRVQESTDNVSFLSTTWGN